MSHRDIINFLIFILPFPSLPCPSSFSEETIMRNLWRNGDDFIPALIISRRTRFDNTFVIICCIFSESYNNDAQYKGEIDANRGMDGTGSYTFPDGSTLTAIWAENKPVSDIVYKQPLGDAWRTTSISDNVNINAYLSYLLEIQYLYRTDRFFKRYHLYVARRVHDWKSFLERNI